MSVDVGDAVWTIKGDTKPIEDALQQGTARVKSATDNIVKHTRAIGIGMIAVGTVVTGAIAGLISGYARAGDEVQKMALRTGLSTEALSEFKHASEISGTSLAAFEKGIKRMAKSIEDGKDGLSTSTRALDKLGVSLESLQGLSPEDAFMRLAGAISQIPDPMQRAAIAQDMFGRAGTQLLPLMMQGSEGIAALRQEAHDLGIVFDQEAADAAAQFQDNMTNLKRSLQGAGFAIAEDLVPWLNELIPKVTEAIKTGMQWIRANQGTITTIAQIAFQLGPVLIAIGTLLVAVPKLIGVFSGITAIAGFLKVGFAAILAGGPITIAIAAVAAAAMLIIANWEKIGPFFASLWQAVVDTVVNAAEAIYYALRFPYDLVVGLIEKLGSLMGFDWTGIPGGFDFGQYQSGGIIKEPFALVGEHGPELITGAQGARVHSASDTAQMLKGGGGTTIEHIEINVDTGGAPVNADRLASELEYALGRRLATVGVTA